MRKGYVKLLAIVLVVGILTTVMHFLPVGDKVENWLTGTFNPDEEVSVYWDNLDEYYDAIVSSTTYERNKYCNKRSGNTSPNDGILLAWTPESVEKAKTNYSHSKLYGYIVPYAFLKGSNVKNSDAELYYKNGSHYYRDVDLGEILWGVYQDKTWNEIGFNSVEKIELWIPNSKDLYYPLYVAQIYASVKEYMYDDSTLNEIVMLSPSDIWTVVDDILSKANYIQGTNEPKLNKNTIVLSVKPILYSCENLNNLTTAVGAPIYVFWNDDAYTKFLESENLVKKVKLLDESGERAHSEINYKPYQPLYEDSETIFYDAIKHMVKI